ncbi:Glycine N-methyltransferase [gamma proteobacterium IMCC1989]|nr:Glycine N-methyltransferase [gamma proteobacterium IMCC1989]
MSHSHAVLDIDDTEQQQQYSSDPTSDRYTDLYTNEYIAAFVKKWDALIDWEARALGEGTFFIDLLNEHKKKKILDVATGTGFHSVSLIEGGFDVTSSDGSATMLARAFENAKSRGHILKTNQADWRRLGESVHERFDAIVCLGNSFSHLHDEMDRRRALAEFYAALKPDGILIIDQRNYDYMLDSGFKTKHKYYYCGDKVSAEPVHLDKNLARFEYTFPGGDKYTLNQFPLRKNYFCQLIRESGFSTIQTFGDFEEKFIEEDSDFFIHVVKKQTE